MKISFLRSLLVVETALLALQFAVGLNVSLYPIPSLINFGLLSYGGTGLGVHHYIAILAVIFAAFAIALSLVTKNSLASKLSMFGFALLLGAFATGIALVYIQKSSYYAIAHGVFFVLALIVYESAIFLVKK
jgi:FtsH-binding integral membrane protein